jgi:hypothetical protein
MTLRVQSSLQSPFGLPRIGIVLVICRFDIVVCMPNRCNDGLKPNRFYGHYVESAYGISYTESALGWYVESGYCGMPNRHKVVVVCRIGIRPLCRIEVGRLLVSAKGPEISYLGGHFWLNLTVMDKNTCFWCNRRVFWIWVSLLRNAYLGACFDG